MIVCIREPKNSRKSALCTNRYRLQRYRKSVLRNILLCAAVIVFRLFFSAVPIDALTLLSDAFMIPGVTSLGWGLIKLSSYYGEMDGFGYSIRWMARLQRKNKRNLSEDEKRELPGESLLEPFSEYCDAQRRNRTFPDADLMTGLGLTIISGLLAVAVF